MMINTASQFKYTEEKNAVYKFMEKIIKEVDC